MAYVYPCPWPLVPKGLSQRTESETARAKSKSEDAAQHARLRALMKLPGNRECADCTCKFPGWGVIPHGVFVCINCAQAHRHIGRHISQTKGITTNTYLWYPDEVDLMETVGNARANTVYMARGGGGVLKPQEDASFETRVQYVRDKYEFQKYLTVPVSAPIVATTAASAAVPAPAPKALPSARLSGSASTPGSAPSLSASLARPSKPAPGLGSVMPATRCGPVATSTTRDLIDLTDWEGFLNTK